MEALSPTMEEGRLVEWKKQEGDPVAPGEVLAEVETDKAVMDLLARAGGTLLKQVIAPGTTVPVSTLVGVIGAPGEDIAALIGGAPRVPAPVPAPAAPRSPNPAPAPTPAPPHAAEAPSAGRPAPSPSPAPPGVTVAGADRVKA